MKNFIQRAITGLIFVAVLIGCMIGGPLSFGILFCIISALATAEFCNLMNQQEGVQINRNICVLGSVALFLCFFYYGMNPAQTGIFIPYLIIIIYPLTLIMRKSNKKRAALEKTALINSSRCLADSNRRRRFCRPLPSHSAKVPLWFASAKVVLIFGLTNL